MLLIKDAQLAVLARSSYLTLIIKLEKFILDKFDHDYVKIQIAPMELVDFIEKNIISAGNFGIRQELSVATYVLLSLINKDEFMKTEKFKVYKYYIENGFYNPNEYVFMIPIVNSFKLK